MRIEVWCDTVSNPHISTWCLSRCEDDGNELQLLSTHKNQNTAIAAGRKIAKTLMLPLYLRDKHGHTAIISQ